MPDIFTTSTSTRRRHRFVIYLPTEGKDGRPLEGIDAVARSAEEVICERLGGVTSYPAMGGFARESGGIQREAVRVLESYCDEANWPGEAAFFGRLAKVLARELDQESIACSLDGEMALATPAASRPRLDPLSCCTADALRNLVGETQPRS